MTDERFRDRLKASELLVGTFLKTPSSIVSEVLGYTTLDTVCIDTEHAPFGRLELDSCIAAFRAANMPCIVRTQNDSSTEIRGALDSGATGILVPHVCNAKQAADIAKAAHFGEGGRGFAGSTRAADYTAKKMTDHLADSAAETTVIVQIEDLAALDNVAAIASVEGIDALFIGRIDLAVAMQASASDPAVIDAVQKICETAKDQGVAVGMFTPDLSEIPRWRSLGVGLFLLSSDHSMLLAGANNLVNAVRAT